MGWGGAIRKSAIDHFEHKKFIFYPHGNLSFPNTFPFSLFVLAASANLPHNSTSSAEDDRDGFWDRRERRDGAMLPFMA